MNTATMTETQNTDDFFTPAAPGTDGQIAEAPYGFPERKLEQFTIQTREHAEWYLRKLANFDREEASIKAQ
uniref:hypothetical protein n=1 Tax=Armatimonas sp. TaxID=1872638 RepID=UPI003753C26E